MGAHLRANLTLLALTVLLCCVIYPAVLWGVGQALFPDQAAGSLLYKPGATAPVGSRLIGQPFTDDKYFWPRPSAAGNGNGYDASASGGYNYAASNPKLRGRIAQLLGKVARYHNGKPVGDDVEAWFADAASRGKDLTGQWAEECPTLAKTWAMSSDVTKSYVTKWAEEHPEVMQGWRNDNPNATSEPKPDDLATYFFKSYVNAHPGTFPCAGEVEVQGKKETQIKPDTKGDDIRTTFFDFWLREHPAEAVDIEPVPVDMVMASGSGLDPHITLKNAEYQAPRIAKAREGKITVEKVKELASRMAFRPLGGIAGDEPLVNVLELNLALDAQ
jgi:potassium-transporting ATPase KdpC subunit